MNQAVFCVANGTMFQVVKMEGFYRWKDNRTKNLNEQRIISGKVTSLVLTSKFKAD